MSDSVKDILFGKIAVQLGYLTQVQLDDGLRIQEELEASGFTPKPLGEILKEIGHLNAEQIVQVIKSQVQQVSQAADQKSVSRVSKNNETNFQIQGYNIIEKIGLGKTGTVYKALQISLQRVVALKILLPHLAQDPKTVESFFNEARIAARLNHPNIVQAIDVGECRGSYYFVMEYIDGPTLEQIIKGKVVLEEKIACDYILQICRALEYACANNMVHRDIKPHNIMINSTGIAKLCDLGAAKLRTRASAIIPGKIRLIGTPAYISPE
jgi:eukaryotic-like serine/threonine-protein kinase